MTKVCRFIGIDPTVTGFTQVSVTPKDRPSLREGLQEAMTQVTMRIHAQAIMPALSRHLTPGPASPVSVRLLPI